MTRNTEYLLLSTPSIDQEQQYLFTELNAINSEYTELLKNINGSLNSKPMKRSRVVNTKNRNNQLRQRDIENNNALLHNLREEMELLDRRFYAVDGGKQYDTSTIEIKEKIAKAKRKIKELKLRTKQMGDNIESGQDMFIDLQRLQEEYKTSEVKKERLQQKMTISNANVKALHEKLEEISSQSSLAESWLNDYSSSQRVNEEEKTMEQLFKQRTYQLQITKKMIESFRNSKQQKYLQQLRGLQDIVQKNKMFDHKLEKLETKNVYQKKEIAELQDLLNQTLNLKREQSRVREKTDLLVVKESEQSIQASQIKNYQKFKLNIIKDPKNISNSSSKTDIRKYYSNRLRSSNTKPELSFNKRMENNRKSPKESKTQLFDQKTLVLDVNSIEFTSMMKQANTSNRSVFRASKTKFKEQPKQQINVQKSDNQVKETECAIQEALQRDVVANDEEGTTKQQMGPEIPMDDVVQNIEHEIQQVKIEKKISEANAIQNQNNDKQ